MVDSTQCPSCGTLTRRAGDAVRLALCPWCRAIVLGWLMVCLLLGAGALWVGWRVVRALAEA